MKNLKYTYVACLTGCFLILLAPLFICPSTTFPEKSQISVFLWFGSELLVLQTGRGQQYLGHLGDAQQHTGAIDPTSTGARSAGDEISALLH